MSEIQPSSLAGILNESVELPDHLLPKKTKDPSLKVVRYLGAQILGVDKESQRLVFDGSVEPGSDAKHYSPGRFALMEARPHGQRGFIADLRELDSGDIKTAERQRFENNYGVSEDGYLLIRDPVAIKAHIFIDPAGFTQYSGPEGFEMAALDLFDEVNEARDEHASSISVIPEVVARNALQKVPKNSTPPTNLPRTTLEKIDDVLREYASASEASPDQAA